MFIYSGFSVLLEVVLSLENITLNANLNFEMIYYVSDPNLRTLGELTPQRSWSLAARGCRLLLCHLSLFRFCLEDAQAASSG